MILVGISLAVALNIAVVMVFGHRDEAREEFGGCAALAVLTIGWFLLLGFISLIIKTI